MMKWLVGAGIVVAVILALVAIIGTRLLRAHTATREARFDVPPQTIWDAITRVDAFPSWRPDVTKVERPPDINGQMVWVEHGSSGRLTLAVDRREPARLLVVRIADPSLPFGGTWTYELIPAAGSTTLAITENGEVYNPLFRFVARYVFGHEGTISVYMSSLKKKVESSRGV
ncbi:MAG: SRPBCC family protein [Acidobacteria bacterium]|nr:SRPBCC family protein [Acidobacteriota bacterium]MCA1651025.1 SRPBCC family protein [Acidobacteriota bacterium]